MFRWALLAVGVAAACNYALDVAPCKITCTSGSSSECPTDYACVGNICQKPGEACAPGGSGGASGNGDAGGMAGTTGLRDAGLDHVLCATVCVVPNVCCSKAGLNCTGMCVPDCRIGDCGRSDQTCNPVGGFCEPTRDGGTAGAGGTGGAGAAGGTGGTGGSGGVMCGSAKCGATQVCCMLPHCGSGTCVMDCRTSTPACPATDDVCCPTGHPCAGNCIKRCDVIACPMGGTCNRTTGLCGP